ncbi:spore cortex biosynthesis protein YabQ [Priestia megaterium]|nr:spore cortex biosynthesis protein YabQ [Priestia megaterium]
MSLNVQFYTMIAMVSMGSFIGASLDTYRYFINRSKVIRWFLFVNDLLFWIVQALLIFYVLFLVNEGELRFYAFLALLCGFAAYQSLLQSLYLKVLTFTVLSVLMVYRLFLRLLNIFLVKPTKLFVRIVVLACLSVYRISYVMISFLFKLIFAPIRWILFIIWKIMPESVKRFFHACLLRIEGFYKQVKNMITRVMTWVKKFKNKGGD